MSKPEHFGSLANHIVHLIYQFEQKYKVRVKDIDVWHDWINDEDLPEVSVTFQQTGVLNEDRRGSATQEWQEG